MKNEKKVQQFLSRSARIGRRRRRIRRRRNQQNLHLPEEIIEEILSRLPVKSLLRLRCVSKSWGSLNGSDRFIKKHHQNSLNNPSFPQQRVIVESDLVEQPQYCSLLSVLSGPTSTIPLSPLADPMNTTLTEYRIVGSCNGLLCILHDQNTIFQLWNPSTRISKKLPEISNPNSGVRNFGFGWVESTNEYKVFVLVVHYYDNSKVGKVYSSKTKSWKTIELCDDLDYCWPGGVFAGGKLYWKNGHDKVIIFWDLKSEVFGRIELPFDQEVYGIVGVLGGFLCVLCFNYKIRGFRVWVMKESWEKVVTLSHLLELLQPPPLVKGLNGEILVNCGFILLVYDCRDNVFRNLKYCSCCEDTGFSSYEDCVNPLSYQVYVESLVSPEDLYFDMEIGKYCLHQEVIEEEILSRLPVKSLLRFRLITLKNSRDRPEECSLQSLLSERPISRDSPDDLVITTLLPFQIWGCYNGLFCVLEKSSKLPFAVAEKPRKIYLWNPSTRSSKKLPEISGPGFAKNYGFGWVESSDEYKVFVLLVGLLLARRVFAGGKLYWKRNGYEEYIIFLDLKSEEFGRIEIPFQQGWRSRSWLVGVVGGCLCVTYYNHGRPVQLWVMKESWKKVATLAHLVQLLLPLPLPLVVAQNREILVNCGSTFVGLRSRR
ncbi:F-box/kelch-repeat protein At3g06240-like [Salvia miltiorrhiza]|uniref:F-box/kelch-repeat protein At3g06240-like n=1 Tax=Salvia miltiorrhiza TaxID=226208 RepID=UPI0025ACA055|nr:F-box/kelch-repeat protein At3g06240-like [Salvia miltiorrhiza]